MAAHNAAKKQKQKLAEIARRRIPSNSSKSAAQRIRGDKGRFLDDAKKTEKMHADDIPSHGNVDLTINTEDKISKPENIENEESEFEKSDGICDKQSTGENDAEYTDIDAPEEVNDLKNKRYFSK